MTNTNPLRGLAATATIELAVAFTPSPLAGGPKVSRYVVTAPVATSPLAIRAAHVVPGKARLTEYNEGVYIWDEPTAR